MIVELRTYRTKPGLRDRFLDIFRARTVPEHARLGMPITGPFTAIDDPDAFVFLRRFPDEATREAVKARFHEGALWRDELEAALMPMLDTYDVVVVDDPEDRLGR